jgi:hypothetical protein
MRLDQTEELPGKVSVRDLQRVLALLFVPTGHTGQWDMATRLGLQAVVKSADLGSSAPITSRLTERGLVEIAPASFLHMLRGAAEQSMRLLVSKPAPAAGLTHGNLLMQLVPMRAMAPVWAESMQVEQQLRTLTSRKLELYNDLMFALDNASFIYADMIQERGLIRERVAEKAAETSGLYTVRLSTLLESYTAGLTRFGGELLETGQLAQDRDVAGILSGPVVISAFAKTAWRQAANMEAWANLERARELAFQLELLPRNAIPTISQWRALVPAFAAVTIRDESGTPTPAPIVVAPAPASGTSKAAGAGLVLLGLLGARFIYKATR